MLFSFGDKSVCLPLCDCNLTLGVCSISTLYSSRPFTATSPFLLPKAVYRNLPKGLPKGDLLRKRFLYLWDLNIRSSPSLSDHDLKIKMPSFGRNLSGPTVFFFFIPAESDRTTVKPVLSGHVGLRH